MGSLYFRGRKIAASLKHDPSLLEHVGERHFRGRKIAASLKLHKRSAEEWGHPISAIERSRPH